jgi:hypothetical protein
MKGSQGIAAGGIRDPSLVHDAPSKNAALPCAPVHVVATQNQLKMRDSAVSTLDAEQKG